MEGERQSQASLEELLALKLQLAHLEQELQAERALVTGLRAAASRACADIVAALSASSASASAATSAATSAGQSSPAYLSLSRQQVYGLFARHFGPYSTRPGDQSLRESSSPLLFGQQALDALPTATVNSASAPLPAAPDRGDNVIEFEEETQLVLSDRL